MKIDSVIKILPINRSPEPGSFVVNSFKQSRINTYPCQTLPKDRTGRNTYQLILWGQHHSDIGTRKGHHKKRQPQDNFLDEGLSQVGSVVRIHLPMQETRIWSLGREDPQEKEMATHYSIRVQRIPWTEEPGRLHSMGSQESSMT